MTQEQALLISLLLGRALDAILAKVREMDEAQIKAALTAERVETDRLLTEMKAIA